jgi:zinc transport system ATP-binding protein
MSELKDIVLKIEDLSFSYGNEEVLRDINLTIKKGEYLGLIGPNGGGKTTLLKLALGLLKPSSGEITWFGKTPFKEWYRVGYVSQKAVDFDSLFPATVEEVVLMGRYARLGLFHWATAEDKKKAEEALQNVNMLEYRYRRISDLSGGQKQRVFIARALASDSEVIVLDEPTTGVDQETQDQFYRLLKDLNGQMGLTLILVSHDLERIAKEASCVAIIERAVRYYSDPQEAVQKEKQVHFHH